jgi:hypothetical protein
VKIDDVSELTEPPTDRICNVAGNSISTLLKGDCLWNYGIAPIDFLTRAENFIKSGAY